MTVISFLDIYERKMKMQCTPTKEHAQIFAVLDLKQCKVMCSTIDAYHQPEREHRVKLCF